MLQCSLEFTNFVIAFSAFNLRCIRSYLKQNIMIRFTLCVAAETSNEKASVLQLVL